MTQIVHETEDLEVFDFAQGLERLRGNRELYCKLLNDFCERYCDCSSAIEGALIRRQREEAHRLVHNLKGLAGNLSATELYEAARALDDRLKERNPDWAAVEKQYLVFRSVLERTMNSAHHLAKARRRFREGAGVSENIPKYLANEVARNIREALELGDIMAIIELSDNPSLGTFLQARIARLAEDFELEGLFRIAEELDKLSGRTGDGA